MRRALVAALALSVLVVAARADDDPEPPRPGQAESLEKLARTMADLAKRLKGGSVGDETRKLQERVLAQLDEALRREKAEAAKVPKERARGRAFVASGLERVRAMQQRLGPDVKRLSRLGE